MKQIIYFSILLLITSCCITKTKKQASTNNIQSILEASYSLRGSIETTRDSALELMKNKIQYFDQNGNLIKQVLFEIDQSLYEKTIIDRDKKGNFTLSVTYDSKGNVKRSNISEFDEQGNLIKITSFNKENTPTSEQVYEYDNSKQVVIKETHIQLPEKSLKTEIFRNSEGHRIKQIDYAADGSVKKTKLFKCNEQGNEIESTLERSNGSLTRFVSTYDDYGNIITQKWYNGDSKEASSTYRFEYIYDKAGNWITKKRYSDGELSYVWERKIEY